MSRTNRRYPPEFRRDAVDHVRRNPDSSIPELAKSLGISPQTLRNWVERDRADRDDTVELSSDEREELKQLRREKRRLTEEQDILKKAAAFFAQDQKR